ncbi:MAG TPA: hypothetical protein VFW35_03050 [Sphingomicrobium sp.]|nr:hypothetical protein [Sphingomicrobium sp.]
MTLAFIGVAVAMLGPALTMFAVARSQVDAGKRTLLRLSGALFVLAALVFLFAAFVGSGR